MSAPNNPNFVTKPCSKCGVETERSGFFRDQRAVDGFHSQCKVCMNANSKAWVIANREKVNANSRKWARSNRGKTAERDRAWKKKNPGKMAEYNAKYQKAHPEKGSAKTRQRCAKKIQAIPGWTNHIAVDEFYSLAAIKTKLTGEKWEVDHIVPLQSLLVCGLHTHYNLQVLKRKDNLSKGNRIWPDMP